MCHYVTELRAYDFVIKRALFVPDPVFYSFCYYSCPHFPPFPLLHSVLPFPPGIPPLVHVHGSCIVLGLSSSYTILNILLLLLKKIVFIYEGKGGRKRGREPGPQARHMPWLGVEPATVWFAGGYSIHWATPARAQLCFLIPAPFPPFFPFPLPPENPPNDL